MKIRPAKVSDVPRLVALNRLAQDMHADACPERFRRDVPEQVVAAAFAAMIQSSSACWLVAEAEQPIAFLSAEFRERVESWHSVSRRVCYLAGIVVAPDFRRRGIARSLLAALKREAGARGAACIELDVWAFNDEARAAFAGLGFKRLMERMALPAGEPKKATSTQRRSARPARLKMNTILQAILDDSHPQVIKLLKADRRLAVQPVEKPRLYRAKVFHWLYAGDTALHLAAAGYRDNIAQTLLTAGADPNAAANHRRSRPLHYAADGYIAGSDWDPKRQVKTIRILLNAGADIHAGDKNGATPLHRAVRTRCAAAVKCLLDAGADPMQRNLSGSTAFHLAVQNTGRGGSGAGIAVAAQRKIIEEFLSRGLSPAVKDAKGKSVRDWATSDWIRNLLSAENASARKDHPL